MKLGKKTHQDQLLTVLDNEAVAEKPISQPIRASTAAEEMSPLGLNASAQVLPSKE